MNIEEVWPKIRRFISLRDRTRLETERYLKTKHRFSQEMAERTIDWLTESGYIDEARFAQNRVDYRMSSGKGPVWIRQELRSLGLDAKVIEPALQNTGSQDWYNEAFRAADRKLQSWIQKEDCEQKIREFLMRRGYEPDTIRAVLTGLKEAYPHWAARNR